MVMIGDGVLECGSPCRVGLGLEVRFSIKCRSYGYDIRLRLGC